MENASKAILIAGAILLVLALIGIAVVVVNNMENTSEDLLVGLDKNEMMLHNNKFLNYEENQLSGSDVKDCISKVLKHNNDNLEDELTMKIFINNVETINRTTTSFDSSTINNFDKYKGTVSYSNGIITIIRFTKL